MQCRALAARRVHAVGPKGLGFTSLQGTSFCFEQFLASASNTSRNSLASFVSSVRYSAAHPLVIWGLSRQSRLMVTVERVLHIVWVFRLLTGLQFNLCSSVCTAGCQTPAGQRAVSTAPVCIDFIEGPSCTMHVWCAAAAAAGTAAAASPTLGQPPHACRLHALLTKARLPIVHMQPLRQPHKAHTGTRCRSPS